MKKTAKVFSGFKDMISMLWNSSKSLTILLIFNNIIRNAIWPLRALVTKEIVEIIVESVNNGFDEYRISFIIYIALFFMFFWLNRIWWPLNSYTQTLLLAKLSHEMRNRMIKIMEDIHLSFFDYSENRDIYERAVQQVEDRQPINAVNTFMGLVSLIISFTTAFISMIAISIPITLLLLVSSVPSFIWEKRFNDKAYQFEQNATCEKRKLDYYFSLFLDKTSAKEIKTFKTSDYLLKKHKKGLGDYYIKYFKLFKYKIKVDSLFWFISIAFLMTSYFIIISDVAVGTLDLGSLSFFLSVAVSLQSALTKFGSSVNGIINSNKYFNNLVKFEQLNSVKEKKDYTKLPEKIEKIVFDHVSFTYPNAENPALDDVSFTLEYPQAVMVVGLNGAGKSTMLKLLLRLYKPDSGRIYVNDIDINSFDEKEYYSLFSACFQEHMNYGFTLKENIILADKNIKDDRFNDVLNEVELSDFVSNLPQKENTCLLREFDENGIELSGGQYSKVAIARAMIKDAPIILLDEPNAALDAKAERIIFDIYENITKDRIGIFITHRLQRAGNVQKILVFKNGKLAEVGSHDELIKQKGEYAALYEMQASHYKMA